MSDKDFTERAVYQAKFPDASLIICLFHTLQSEVTCEKLGIHLENVNCVRNPHDNNIFFISS